MDRVASLSRESPWSFPRWLSGREGSVNGPDPEVAAAQPGVSSWLPAALLAAAFLVAIVYRGPGVDLPLGGYALLMLWFAGLVSLVAVVTRDGERFRVQWWLFGAFAALLAANVQFALLPENSFVPALTLMSVPVSCVIAWHLIDRGWAHGFALGAAAAGAVLGVLALAEFAASRVRVAGPMVDPNLFASLLNLLFFVTWGRIVTLGEVRSRPLWLASAALILIALACTFSRAALVCWCIVYLGFAVMLLRAGVSRSVVLVPPVVLALAVFAVTMLAESEVAQRLGADAHLARGLGYRQAMWGAAVFSWLQEPWLGHGAQSFQLLYPPIRPLAEQVSGGTFVHNDYLQALHDGGPLLLAFVALFVALMGRVWTDLWRPRASPWAWQCAGMGGGVLAVALQAEVNFALYVLVLLIGFGITLGCVTWRPPRERPGPRLLVAVLGGGTIAVLGALLAVDMLSSALLLGQRGVPGVDWIRADIDRYDRTLRLLERANPQRALPVLGRAALERYRTRHAGSPRERLIAYGRTIRLYERALGRDPWHVGGFLSYAAFLIENRDLLPAQRLDQIPGLANAAIGVDPADIGAYLLLSRWYEREGQPLAALRVLDERWYPWLGLMLRRFPENSVELLETMADLGRRLARPEVVRRAEAGLAWAEVRGVRSRGSSALRRR